MTITNNARGALPSGSLAGEIPRGRLPRIILVTDTPPLKNSIGAYKTLQNLFVKYPMGEILCVAPDDAFNGKVDNPELTRPTVRAGSRSHFPIPLNRCRGFSSLLNLAINSHWNDRARGLVPDEARRFKADLIIACPMDWWGVVMAMRMGRELNLPVVPYFMDNILSGLGRPPWTGLIWKRLREMLTGADGWIMISKTLAEDLAASLGVPVARRLCISHNPVELSKMPAPKFGARQGPEFRILYTGSIWAMHIDAIEIVARAVALLRKAGLQVSLDIATQEKFWDEHRARFEPHGVRYVGFLSHDACFRCMAEADLLLVAVSFQDWLLPFARGSFQTKMTDYMSTGRPILCCGPATSVCGSYLEENRCGYFWKKPDPEGLALFLQSLIHDQTGQDEAARNAYALLERDYSAKKMQGELYTFLEDTASQRIAT